LCLGLVGPDHAADAKLTTGILRGRENDVRALKAGKLNYGVTADGQRFLFLMPAADNLPPELKLVLDWPALLGKQNRPAVAPTP